MRALSAAVASATVVLAVWTSASQGARPAQGIPEYGVLLSAMAGGLQKTVPVYTCPGPDLTGITEALDGPQAVRRLGLELVAGALGSPKHPWPRNHRAFTYRGRSWTPDFVKGRTFYLVETADRLTLTREIADLQAIARQRGGDLVVVTRRRTAVSQTLSAAASRSWKGRRGRIRIVRCV